MQAICPLNMPVVKGMVFRQFSLGQGIEIRQSCMVCNRYNLPGTWPVYK